MESFVPERALPRRQTGSEGSATSCSVIIHRALFLPTLVQHFGRYAIGRGTQRGVSTHDLLHSFQVRREYRLPPSINGEARLHPIGTVAFQLFDTACQLQVLWLDAYGGGIFIPFRDATCGSETYGGGRYLLDSVKGAELGSSFESETLTLDFNYAYHPSCAYDPIWPCPLAPP